MEFYPKDTTHGYYITLFLFLQVVLENFSINHKKEALILCINTFFRHIVLVQAVFFVEHNHQKIIDFN